MTACKPFIMPKGWEALVLAHSAILFPKEVWNTRWQLHGQQFIPVIQSTDQSLFCQAIDH
jgi:hypothetical protein